MTITLEQAKELQLELLKEVVNMISQWLPTEPVRNYKAKEEILNRLDNYNVLCDLVEDLKSPESNYESYPKLDDLKAAFEKVVGAID